MQRFTGVDPLAEEMPAWSSFSYGFNSPVRFIDPDGKAPQDIIILLRNNNGKTTHLKYSNRELYEVSGNLYKGKDQFARSVQSTLNKALDLNDNLVTHVLSTLETSNIKHFIEADEVWDNNRVLTPYDNGDKGANGIPQSTQIVLGTFTDDHTLEDNLPANRVTTLVHEAQHSYDYDQGKMIHPRLPDGQKHKSMSETRAVFLENRARHKMGMEERKKYGSGSINFEIIKDTSTKSW